MFLTSKIIQGGVAAVGIGITTVNQYIKENYPPKIQDLSKESSLIIEGKKFYPIGYFGASKKTVENLDLERETYVGDLKTAQYYAQNRAKDSEEAATALLVSPVRSLCIGDLGMQRFEGAHAPIRPDALRDLDVQVIKIDPVNIHTKHGLIAGWRRAVEAFRKK